MYFVKVYLDEDDRTSHYLNIIEELDNRVRRIAWISVRARAIYKSVKQPLPVIDRTAGLICVQDSSYRDCEPERGDPVPEEPWYEEMGPCLARLGLPASLEETVRGISENPATPSAPAQHFVMSHGLRDRERLFQSRVDF